MQSSSSPERHQRDPVNDTISHDIISRLSAGPHFELWTGWNRRSCIFIVRLRHNTEAHQRDKHDPTHDAGRAGHHFPLSTGSNHDLCASWDGRARFFIVWLRGDARIREQRDRDHVGHSRRLSVGPHKHMRSKWPRATCVLLVRLCRSDGIPVRASTAGAVASAITFTLAAAVTRIRDYIGACFRDHVYGSS